MENIFFSKNAATKSRKHFFVHSKLIISKAIEYNKNTSASSERKFNSL